MGQIQPHVELRELTCIAGHSLLGWQRKYLAIAGRAGVCAFQPSSEVPLLESAIP